VSSTEIPLDMKTITRVATMQDIGILVETLRENQRRLLERWQEQRDEIAALSERVRKLEIAVEAM
jgi:hypothetical protein